MFAPGAVEGLEELDGKLVLLVEEDKAYCVGLKSGEWKEQIVRDSDILYCDCALHCHDSA